MKQNLVKMKALAEKRATITTLIHSGVIITHTDRENAIVTIMNCNDLWLRTFRAKVNRPVCLSELGAVGIG